CSLPWQTAVYPIYRNAYGIRQNRRDQGVRNCVMEIRPIRNDADYRAALEEIERVWEAEPGTSEGDHVEVLSTLVEVYEASHHPVPPPDPIAAIEFMLEQKGLTRRDLEPAIGSRGRVSEVLNRK